MDTAQIGSRAAGARVVYAEPEVTAVIDELRRIYVDYKPTIAYYEERARSPRNAIPAMEFADMLKKQQQKETT